VECADQTGCGTGPAGQSWDYQACGEIVYYPNTNNVTDMFPPRDWTLADLNAHCQRTWGITPRPTWLKTYTGGTCVCAAFTTFQVVYRVYRVLTHARTTHTALAHGMQERTFGMRAASFSRTACWTRGTAADSSSPSPTR
jgi:hypothetical protein